MPTSECTLRSILSIAGLVSTALLVSSGCSADRAASGPSSSSDTSARDTGVATETPSGPRDAGPSSDSEAPRDASPVQPPSERDASDAGGVPPPDIAWDFGPSPGDDGSAGPLELTRISPARGPVSGGTKFTLEGSGLTPETTIYFGSRETETEWVRGRLVGRTPKAAGPGPVTVKAIDGSGESDEERRASLEKGFTYVPELRFDSARPADIPARGGFQVTLRGAGLTPETRVSFDGRTAIQHEFVDAETMRVVAPPNEAGPADLRLTNQVETLRVESAVTYLADVQIDRARPAAGPVEGGTSVRLAGEGFAADMTVLFGGREANVVSVASNGRRATVETPAGSAGLADVVVRRSEGGDARLEDGFYYRTSNQAFELAAVRPDRGSSNGGTRVTLVGAGLDRSGVQVDVDGRQAAIVERGTGYLVVQTPANPDGAETVDVSVSAGGTTKTLTDVFRYVRPLEIASVSPGSGPTSGGTTVTIRGEGFQNVTDVEFGSVSAVSISRVDSQTLEVETPARAAGRVDVVVERGDVRAEQPDAFLFEGPLELYGLSPARGSIAGNTRVVLRGRGFVDSNLSVRFGGRPARSIQRLDARTLAVRTPPRAPGPVDVVVTRGGDTARVADGFTYYNPASRSGGTWGGPIEGSVNVAVYTSTGQPLPEAFVMLSTRASTAYKGRTDRNGLVTFSGPGVEGRQTVTAAAANFSSVTIQHVDAENITLFLSRRSPPDPSDPPRTGRDAGRPALDGGPPPPDVPPPDTDASPPDLGGGPDPRLDTGDDPEDDPPDGPDDPPEPEKPPPRFRGEVEGLGKLGFPGPNEVQRAFVYTTTRTLRSRNPEPGPRHVVGPGGTYVIDTRTGDLALVAIGGLYNTKTDEFEPLEMGVKRYQNGIRGEQYQRDIELTHPLDQTISFKIQNPPFHPEGPDWHEIQPHLDFGPDGLFGRLPAAEGPDALIRAPNYPALTGKLDDLSVSVFGGAYTSVNRGNGLRYPASLAIKRGIPSTSKRVTMPPLLGVPRLVVPEPGERPTHNLIEFELTSPERPDFFYVRIYDRDNDTVWDAYIRGSTTRLRLPNFPDFASAPESRRPTPYPDGEYRLRIFAIRHPSATLDTFNLRSLNLTEWSAYALSFDSIRF